MIPSKKQNYVLLIHCGKTLNSLSWFLDGFPLSDGQSSNSSFSPKDDICINVRVFFNAGLTWSKYGIRKIGKKCNAMLLN